MFRVDAKKKTLKILKTLHEILYGLRKYAKPVKEVLQLPVLNYTNKDASLSANIELEAESKGASIRRTDAMIAAITINKGVSLYTLDLKHFQPLKAIGELSHTSVGLFKDQLSLSNQLFTVDNKEVSQLPNRKR